MLKVTERKGAELPVWPRTPPVQAVRVMAQGPTLAALHLLTPATVRGQAIFADLRGPVIFVANHSSHLDTPIALGALPAAWRHQVTIAAAADYFFEQAHGGWWAALLFNAFPFNRSASPRTTLAQCTALLDSGWSILLYPEGTRSTDGQIGNFKGGVGLLAVASGVPVVPIGLSGLFAVMPRGRHLPRPGSVTVRFGPPLRFLPGTHGRDATAAIELAVRALVSAPANTAAANQQGATHARPLHG